MTVTKYEDLEIWNISIDIALEVYRLTRKQQFSKDFGLRDQVRRAAVSISSNIVEGFERANNNEFIQYLKIAKGSTGETKNQLFIAQKLSYISFEEYASVQSKLESESYKIGKFLIYLKSKKNNKEFQTR